VLGGGANPRTRISPGGGKTAVCARGKKKQGGCRVKKIDGELGSSVREQPTMPARFARSMILTEPKRMRGKKKSKLSQPGTLSVAEMESKPGSRCDDSSQQH